MSKASTIEQPTLVLRPGTTLSSAGPLYPPILCAPIHTHPQDQEKNGEEYK